MTQKKTFKLDSKTRPDTRRADGQEQCWRKSLGHLGRSRMLKKVKNAKKVKRGPTDRPTDRRIDIAECRVAQHATRNISSFK